MKYFLTSYSTELRVLRINCVTKNYPCVCPFNPPRDCGEECPLFEVSTDGRVANLRCGQGRKIILVEKNNS
jgi:hypothetical protein